MSAHKRSPGPHKYNDPFYPGEKVKIGREVEGRIEWAEGLVTVVYCDDEQTIFLEDLPFGIREGDLMQSV